MTHIRIIGGEQRTDWTQHDKTVSETIESAKRLIDQSLFEKARLQLDPLIRTGNAEALFVGARFSWGDESEEDFDSRYLAMMTKSAELFYPPALYVVGYHYDVGELVPLNKSLAMEYFIRAAELGHAHSQWLYGIALLYGTETVAQDVSKGLTFVRASAEARFQGALETLARFHETGEFSFEIDPALARVLREKAQADDAISY